MSRYVFYNNNPNGDREEDCVCRAITLATGLPYQEIQEKLYLTGKLLGCEKLCICCYRHLIENVFKFVQVDGDNLYVGEFADKHPTGIYLVRMNGHISVIIDGTVYDIWDCRYADPITDVWLVSK